MQAPGHVSAYVSYSSCNRHHTYGGDCGHPSGESFQVSWRPSGVVPGMYFIPPDMAPNFFVDKGFKFFTMPWARWALEGIKNGLGGIKRD